MQEQRKKKRFSWRGWTTFVVTISFIVDTLSGIILYIAPPGRVANWSNWKIWGLSKGEWGAIHTIFGYVLLIIVGIHLYYNWKMFWNFVWSKIRKALNLKWEMALSAFSSSSERSGIFPPSAAPWILVNILRIVGRRTRLRRLWPMPSSSALRNSQKRPRFLCRRCSMRSNQRGIR